MKLSEVKRIVDAIYECDEIIIDISKMRYSNPVKSCMVEGVMKRRYNLCGCLESAGLVIDELM